MGCGDTFAGNLAIYSNQYSNSPCLKSCKVCLNGAVRAFHLAALGPHPCCKGQLRNAWTIREIIKLTQLEPRLGSVPGLQGLCACCGYSCSDTGVTAVWDIRDRVKGQLEGEGVLQAGTPQRYPRSCQQHEERSQPAQGPPAWDAPAQGFERRILGLSVLLS